jgi:hypothetical protein
MNAARDSSESRRATALAATTDPTRPPMSINATTTSQRVDLDPFAATERPPASFELGRSAPVTGGAIRVNDPRLCPIDHARCAPFAGNPTAYVPSRNASETCARRFRV